jgi:hypothetical protein
MIKPFKVKNYSPRNKVISNSDPKWMRSKPTYHENTHYSYYYTMIPSLSHKEKIQFLSLEEFENIRCAAEAD